MKAPLFLLLGILLAYTPGQAQPAGCRLQPPTVHIDFGKGDTPDFTPASLTNYDRTRGSCPTDGHYTFTSATYDCFAGDWFTITADHTPGDVAGNMMLVNAAPQGGVFLRRNIEGLKAGSRYEVALWMINVCRLGICCSSLSPDVSFVVSTAGGKKLAGFRVGDLPQRHTAQWRKFAGYFTVPHGEGRVVLTMLNSTVGGCGNDFALDDITFSECVPIEPIVAKATILSKPQPKTKPQPAPKEVVVRLSAPPSRSMAKNPEPVNTEILKPVLSPSIAAPVLKPILPLPEALRTRANPLVRQIFTHASELLVDLYDNGQVDGDTVSVYHNNELVMAAARLSQVPLRLRITINAANPHHELVMVAHNLGSIPPNTSLMVVTAGDQKYQVNISASEQKNARVVFDWKE